MKERLSTIINILNERFGTDFTQADQLALDQIEEELVANEVLAEQAKVNSNAVPDCPGSERRHASSSADNSSCQSQEERP